jgi:hypothetical protein
MPSGVRALTSEQKRNLAAIRRIRVLCRFLGIVVREPDKDGWVEVPGDPSRYESCISFNPLTGAVKRTTWETSGHNGDPYGYEHEVLGMEAGLILLQGEVLHGLEHRALEHERKVLEKAKERRLHDEAMKNLNAKLKQFGG